MSENREFYVKQYLEECCENYFEDNDIVEFNRVETLDNGYLEFYFDIDYKEKQNRRPIWVAKKQTDFNDIKIILLLRIYNLIAGPEERKMDLSIDNYEEWLYRTVNLNVSPKGKELADMGFEKWFENKKTAQTPSLEKPKDDDPTLNCSPTNPKVREKLSGYISAVNETAKPKDNVNSPLHYKKFPVEIIEIISWLKKPYNLISYEIGNVVKYLFRAPFKGNLIEDLKKAQWYLQRAITELEKDNKE